MMKKLFCIVLIIYWCSFLFGFNDNGYHAIKIFDFNQDFPEKCLDDDKNHCYTVEEMVTQAITNGMDAKEKIQVLFQAKKTIRTKIGQILPHVNIASAGSNDLGISTLIDAVSSFVGFIFPNRWFEVKASKRLRDAEMESLGSLYGDIAQHVQRLYFAVQQQIWSLRILDFYINELDRLKDFLINQPSTDMRHRPEDIAILNNIKARLIYERAFIDALSFLLPQLAMAMGLSPDEDWSHLKLIPCDIGSLDNLTERNYHDFWSEAEQESTEIKNMKHLQAYARHHKRAVWFDIFDPASSSDIGLSYFSRIKIAKSNVETMNIQYERTRRQLSLAIQEALNNYNDSIISYPSIEIGLESLDTIRKAVETNINDKSVPFNVNIIARYFDYSERQSLRHINTYFTFRSAEADLNRYTWRGNIYDIVRHHKDIDIMNRLEEEKKNKSFRTAIKNKFKRLSKHHKSEKY